MSNIHVHRVSNCATLWHQYVVCCNTCQTIYWLSLHTDVRVELIIADIYMVHACMYKCLLPHAPPTCPTHMPHPLLQTADPGKYPYSISQLCSSEWHGLRDLPCNGCIGDACTTLCCTYGCVQMSSDYSIVLYRYTNLRALNCCHDNEFKFTSMPDPLTC